MTVNSFRAAQNRLRGEKERVYTREFTEDDIVLLTHSLDMFHKLAEVFDHPASVMERCDELMVRVIGDETIKAHRARPVSL